MGAAFIIVVAGILLGIFSAMAPLGPVVVLVIRRAIAGDHDTALAIGMGRVPVEAAYCACATFGVVALLERFPAAKLSIELLGTLVFLAVGVWLLVQGPPTAEAAPEDPRARKWGKASGFIISVVNPTLLLSWSAIVGVVVSMFGYSPRLFDKIGFPLALAVGLAIGCWLLVTLIERWGERLERTVVQRATQLMGLVFVLLSLWNGVQLLRA